ncbi:MAG: NAD-dependent epimerase/dehydratase family protein, partial [Erysipelotrichia bacterium]|nr:NAD-dependent epimerase/dehydratase family protein [Erysipelotrichia bacterium]
MHRILVTGANGQVGSEIKGLSVHYAYTFYFTCKENLDITNEIALKNFILSRNITAIINCAAYTAVDKAESDVENADAINHKAVMYLANIAKEQNITLIHISTDYIFDGTNHKPYTETDRVNPQSVYGKTKLDGEIAAASILPETIIIRTAWVFSEYGNNFVKTM